MSILDSNLNILSNLILQPQEQPQEQQEEEQENEEKNEEENETRRSIRNINEASLLRPDVKRLFEKIENNHSDTIVFKIKAHVHTDITTLVFDKMIEQFYKNNVCQAMYIQNISTAIYDKQLQNLINLLKVKRIWCINLGENYSVSQQGWITFCNSLPLTSVTHLYVSEHIIPIELKNKMREYIRLNRKKHNLHSSIQNIRIISQCTHMWWNPINSIRHQLNPKQVLTTQKSTKKILKLKTETTELKTTTPKTTKTKRKLEIRKKSISPKKQRKESNSIDILKEDPSHTSYWAQGTGGKGAIESWKFDCICGEVCSSYENYRYHPVGAMYACTTCGIWSHVVCMLGTNFSLDDLEEMETVYCKKCISKVRREKIRELRDMNMIWENNELRNSNNEDGDNNDEEKISESNGIDENINN